MTKIDAQALYATLKHHNQKYDEETHCPLLLDVMQRKGTMSAFLLEAKISEKTFYNWLKWYPIFSQCYDIAKSIAKEAWEEEARNPGENFDINHWKHIGSIRGHTRMNKVHVDIRDAADPSQQYRAIMEQAADGAFTASELKQIMEAVNVGIRAHESFELQKQIDAMKADLQTIGAENGEDSSAVTDAQEEN
jgi:hypothetical protein